MVAQENNMIILIHNLTFGKYVASVFAAFATLSTVFTLFHAAAPLI